jgi:hypothetical protein
VQVEQISGDHFSCVSSLAEKNAPLFENALRDLERGDTPSFGGRTKTLTNGVM